MFGFIHQNVWDFYSAARIWLVKLGYMDRKQLQQNGAQKNVSLMCRVPEKAILLYHDNALSHIAALNLQFLAENIVEPPLYSHDPATYEFCIFFT